jgi:hypothetical protein
MDSKESAAWDTCVNKEIIKIGIKISRIISSPYRQVGLDSILPFKTQVDRYAFTSAFLAVPSSLKTLART